MEIFWYFMKIWPRIDQASLSTAIDDESMKAIVISWKDNVIALARNQLERYQPRDDYRELLGLP